MKTTERKNNVVTLPACVASLCAFIQSRQAEIEDSGKTEATPLSLVFSFLTPCCLRVPILVRREESKE